MMNCYAVKDDFYDWSDDRKYVELICNDIKHNKIITTSCNPNDFNSLECMILYCSY